jgi:hypothetical protein
MMRLYVWELKRMKHLIVLSVTLALGLGNSFAGLIPRASNDRDFVELGRNRGYYMVSSDSGKWWRWGLVRAPVEEPRMFTHGFGYDAIAIPFDAHGRVAFAPVYIYTINPESYQRLRLAALFQGVSTQGDVRSIFGRPEIQTEVRGYEVWYYDIKVYNPFEEFPDLDGH